jgi:hypothetical protein
VCLCLEFQHFCPMTTFIKHMYELISHSPPYNGEQRLLPSDCRRSTFHMFVPVFLYHLGLHRISKPWNLSKEGYFQSGSLGKSWQRPAADLIVTLVFRLMAVKSKRSATCRLSLYFGLPDISQY